MKIEKGCLAIVINGTNPIRTTTNIGKIVRVGNFLGYLKGFIGSDWWEVDQSMSFINGFGIREHHYFAPEKFLQRIDEPPEQETITDELEITESA